MYRLRLTLPLLVLAVVAAGCATTVYDTRYPDRRYPDRRQPDTRRVDHRTSRYYQHVEGDVRAYVRTLDRHLRLDRRQQQRIQRLLGERTYRLLDRTRPREHARVYPFPRRTDHRYRDTATERWWRTLDAQIERTLDRRQRDAYRSITRRYDDRYYRDGRRYDEGKNRGSNRGRGQKRGHYDQSVPDAVPPRGATLQPGRDA